MADSGGSDSEVEFAGSRKRKFNQINALEDENDYSDEDDEDSEGDDDEDESDDEESGDNDEDAVNDVDLAEDVDGDQCSICLMEFTDQLLGVPNSCTHIFCSICIQEWSKNVNTCPVDRKIFHAIAIYKTKDGPVIDQLKVEDRTTVEEEYEDPRVCEICGVGDREDRMLLCDRCDRGFHLECLTPPLDSVPDGEWYCSNCELDSSNDYQSLDLCPDGDMTSVQQENNDSTGLDQAASRPNASIPVRRRARTVATARRRRRTRGQSESRRIQHRNGNERSSSRQGGSSSVLRGKRKTKKKRRKRRKRKRKTRESKGKLAENNERKRFRNDVSPSRYVLPDEMEATASFSLFGSDLDLDYLPVVEAPARVAKPRSEDQKASTTSNPDVLGSIFTDLNTLYRKDVSLDKQGRLKVSDDPKDTKSESHSVGETSVSVTNASCEKQKPTSSSTANETSGRKVPIAEEHHAKSLLSRDNRDNRDNEDKKDNKGYHTEDSNSYVRKKRLSYFDTNARTSKGGTGHTLGTISRSRDSTTTTSGGSDKEPCVIDLMRKLKAREERNYVVTDTKSRETSSKPRLPKSLKDPAGATVLSSYKIPRKKSSSASGLSLGTRKEVPLRKESDDGWKQNPASNKARRTMTSKSVGYSQPNSGILHLLPETPLNGRNFHKTKSYIPSVSQSSTAPSGRNSQVQKTRLRITSDEQKSVSSVKVYESQRTKTSKPRSINNCEKNSASKSHFGSNCSKKTAFTKIHQKNCTTSTSTGKQTVTNLSIIEMINQRKSVLSESEPDTTDNACSGTIVDIENADFDGQLRRPRSARILPPITSASSCTRPVAVVHPNTQRTPETSGTLSGADATKRRKEGIERLRRPQKISDEVKEALKPFYRHKEITKDHYKLIYKRAVLKITESTAPVETRGVTTLVRNYVKKIKGKQLNLDVR